MPWFVNRTGAKWALIIAGLIMSVRIVGSAVAPRPGVDWGGENDACSGEAVDSGIGL